MRFDLEKKGMEFKRELNKIMYGKLNNVHQPIKTPNFGGVEEKQENERVQPFSSSSVSNINKCSTIGCLKSKNKIDTLFCPECRKGWVKYCIISGISGFDFLDDHDLSYFLRKFKERRISL